MKDHRHISVVPGTLHSCKSAASSQPLFDRWHALSLHGLVVVHNR
jgi:hypothetical protein